MASSNYSSVCELAENWCDTKMRVHQVKYIWAIDNFDFREAVGSHLNSPTFSAIDDPQTRWHLQLKPNGETDAKDTVSLYAHFSKQNRDDSNDDNTKCIFFKFNASILDCLKKKVLREPVPSADKAIIYKYCFSNPTGWGYSQFIKKNEYFKQNLLSNNKLTFNCTVTYFRERDPLTDTIHRCNSNPLYSYVSPCNLVESFGKLFENHKFADVVLSVKIKEYPAHKAILAARSSVFAAMFEHSFKENESNRIEIEDMNEETVFEMLRYIYTGKCENAEKLADGLLAAADKYDLDQLKIICAEALYKTLSVDNALNILALADLHSVAELKSATIKFIVSQFAEVVASTAWKNILVSHPDLTDEVCQAVAGRSKTASKGSNQGTSPESKRSRVE